MCRITFSEESLTDTPHASFAWALPANLVLNHSRMPDVSFSD